MMPLYDFQCPNGHVREEFFHTTGFVHSPICECGHSMGRAVSIAKPLLWAEEGRERRIQNLDWVDSRTGEYHRHRPIKSHRDYEKAMKEAGVSPAGSRMGERGSWI